MLPPDAPAAGVVAPEVMGPPIVWLASEADDRLHDERIIAAGFGPGA